MIQDLLIFFLNAFYKDAFFLTGVNRFIYRHHSDYSFFHTRFIK